MAASTDTFGTVDDVYLQQLAGMATRITLARGESHRVDFATTTLNGESASQAGPDFSGTWTLATSMRAGAIEGRGNNNPAGLRVGPSPHKLVLDQRADRLRIEEHYSIPGGLNTVEYAFNGQPVANPFFLLRSAQEPTAPSEVTTKWQDGKLVATIAVFEPGESAPRHYVRTLSIDPEGRLVVRIQRVGSADARTLFYDKGK